MLYIFLDVKKTHREIWKLCAVCGIIIKFAPNSVLMPNRSATDVIFGFQFQANAAIVLMLENIRDMESIRLEGVEDIEITLDDGSSVLAQAKSVVRSSEDFTNVLKNLKKSLKSLSEAEHKVKKVKELIYITNTPNPFNEKPRSDIFIGASQRSYASLPQALKNQVDSMMAEDKEPLDTRKFKIQILPFETDDPKERYKCVINVIGDFIAELELGNVSISRKRLHEIWALDIFESGSKRNHKITLNKKDIIWPVIVLITKNTNFEAEDLDASEVEEISRNYEAIINTCTEQYDFFTKVLYAYNDFQRDAKIGERMRNFVETESCRFGYIFDGMTMKMPDYLQQKLLQVIVRNILGKRIQIEKIKKEVNL